MVTSPYEWKILEWDENPQTNKQTNSSATLYLYYLHILGFYTWLDKHPGQSDLRDYRERMRTVHSSRLQHSYYQGLKCKICPVLKKTASLSFNRDFVFQLTQCRCRCYWNEIKITKINKTLFYHHRHKNHRNF